MNSVVDALIAERKPKTDDEYFQILRESVHQIALLGLWRAKFFENAAFYGGTALRILHDLPRFSEDLDFTLLKEQPDFSISRFSKLLLEELEAFQFEMNFIEDRSGPGIYRAQIEGNCQRHLTKIKQGIKTQANRKIQVKFEIELSPPIEYNVETKPLLYPIPFLVRTLSLPDLFAGKLHAVLFRNWGNNVKGRDWFDFLWFVGRKIPVRLAHLQRRMERSGDWNSDRGALTTEMVRALLVERVRKLNWSQAKRDIVRFLRSPGDLDAWNEELFLHAISKTECA